MLKKYLTIIILLLIGLFQLNPQQNNIKIKTVIMNNKNKILCDSWKPLKLKSDIYIFEKNDIKIAYKYYQKNTNKKTILFLYGFGANIEMVNLFAPYLAEDYTVLTIDYPGHGYSPKQDSLKYDVIIKTINNLLEELGENEIILIGYSFGGIFALDFYKDYHEKVKKLVLIHSTSNFCETKHKKRMFNFFNWYLNKNFKSAITNFAIPILKDKYFTKKLLKQGKQVAMYNYPQNVISLYNEIIFTNKDNVLQNINCPSLFIGSKIDKLVSERATLKMEKSVKNSKSIIFNNYGHYSIMSKPKEVAQIVKDFLNETVSLNY